MFELQIFVKQCLLEGFMIQAIRRCNDAATQPRKNNAYWKDLRSRSARPYARRRADHSEITYWKVSEIQDRAVSARIIAPARCSIKGPLEGVLFFQVTIISTLCLRQRLRFSGRRAKRFIGSRKSITISGSCGRHLPTERQRHLRMSTPVLRSSNQAKSHGEDFVPRHSNEGADLRKLGVLAHGEA